MLIDQLKLQHEASQRLKAERLRNGALEFETIEATPVAQGGRIVDLKVVHKNEARDLIEDFMIASNVAIAKYPRGEGALRDPARRPRAGALGRGSSSWRGGTARRCRPSRIRSRWPSSSPRAGPPTRTAFQISQ